MTWFAFKGYNSGKAIDIAGVQEKEAAGVGFHGYGTESQAEAHPNSVNFFNKWIVNALIADYHVAVRAGEQPGGPNANILNPVNAVKGTVQAAASYTGLSAIGDFFSRLTNPHTWLRVAEALVGIAFLVIGLNHLLHNPIGKAADATPVGKLVRA